jgi:hypothetical protein
MVTAMMMLDETDRDWGNDETIDDTIDGGVDGC